MKKQALIPAVILLLLSIFLVAMNTQKEEMLEIGEAMPGSNVEMLNVDDTKVTLESISQENGLLVIFSCNTCPFVIGNGTKSEGWENRYPGLGNKCAELNVGMVLVNPNEAKRTAGDSFEDMQKRYKDKDYNCYYVVDENSALADMFGALTTPHVYLFNADGKLVYRGAIDDNVNREKDVKEHYLDNALDNMVKGNKISPETTKQLGCSIKRV